MLDSYRARWLILPKCSPDTLDKINEVLLHSKWLQKLISNLESKHAMSVPGYCNYVLNHLVLLLAVGIAVSSPLPTPLHLKSP